MSQDWLIEVVDGAAVVTMNSTKANTIDGNFVTQFGKMLDKLEHDATFNKLPVVLTGHGAYFSAGFDLKAFAAGNIDAVGGLFGYMLRMLSFPRPVVAAVNGHCMAAGFFVGLSCDHMIAAEGTYNFQLTEILIGMPIPSLGMEMLRLKVPFHVSNELALFGLPMSPRKALEAGLVQAVFPKDQLIQEAIKLAKRVPPMGFEAFAILKNYMIAPLVERIKSPEALRNEEIFVKNLKAKQKEIVAYMAKALGNSSKSKL